MAKKEIFNPSTDRIAKLAEKYPKKIEFLSKSFTKKTNIYIDYANVFHWQKKLGWHIDFKRLIQLLRSYTNVNKVVVYQGVLNGNEDSRKTVEDLEKWGYVVRTKPVKEMNLSIDMTGTPIDSPFVIKDYIDKALLGKFDLETIEFLNERLLELNRQGITHIKHLKCNFDVELASDMLIDNIQDESIENFVLWSGDSDFADTIEHLKTKGKNAIIFATSRRISIELSQTGSFVFELKKIKDFICWSKEIGG